MHVHTRACLSATCVHSWIQEFSPGWWAVRTHLVEKSPDNVFSPQLILQRGSGVQWGGGGGGGQWLFQRNYNFSRVQVRGQQFQGVQPFPRRWGPIAFFYKTCCFPGGSGLPVPPLDSRIAYVHVSMFVAF